MKTTYKYKNSNANTGSNTNESTEVASNNLVETFFYLKEKSKINQQMQESVSVSHIDDISQSYQDTQNKRSNNSGSVNVVSTPKKKSKLPIIAVAVLAIIIIGVGSVVFMSVQKKKSNNEGYDAVVASIENIFTDETHTQLNDFIKSSDDLTVYYEALAPYDEMDFNTSEQYSILGTVSIYLLDRSKLEGIMSDDYNMLSPDYALAIEEVRNNAAYSYAVDGLKQTIEELCNTAESDVSFYQSIKSSIQLDIDEGMEDFDVSMYLDSIALVPHDIQRRELEAMVYTVAYDVAVEDAKNSLNEASVAVENEGIDESELSKEEIEARETAILERDARVAEATEALNAAELNMFNAHMKLYLIQDEMNGTNTAEEYQKLWDKNHKEEKVDNEVEDIESSLEDGV